MNPSDQYDQAGFRWKVQDELHRWNGTASTSLLSYANTRCRGKISNHPTPGFFYSERWRCVARSYLFCVCLSFWCFVATLPASHAIPFRSAVLRTLSQIHSRPDVDGCAGRDGDQRGADPEHRDEGSRAVRQGVYVALPTLSPSIENSSSRPFHPQ